MVRDRVAAAVLDSGPYQGRLLGGRQTCCNGAPTARCTDASSPRGDSDHAPAPYRASGPRDLMAAVACMARSHVVADRGLHVLSPRSIVTASLILGLIAPISPWAEGVSPTHAATWPTDPSVNVPICTAPGYQVSPKLCSDGAGGAIIVWADYRTGQSDVYVQRIGVDGAPLWTTNGVAVGAGTGQQTLSVIACGSGGALIAWNDLASATQQIRVQRVGSDGQPIWAPGGIALNATTDVDHEAAILGDGVGGAIVAWYDRGSRALIAQHLDANGAPTWSDPGVMIPGTIPGYTPGPVLVPDGSGGAIIVWTNTQLELRGLRIGAGGSPLWPAGGVRIDGDVASLTPSISDGAGGAIVSWTHRVNGEAHVIYAQRVDAGGVPRWATNGLALSAPARLVQDRSALASDGAGGAIVAWHDARAPLGGSQDDIYAQRVSAGGSLLWSPVGVPVCTTPGSQVYASVCADGSGGAIIAWEDGTKDTARVVSNDHDVYAQRVNSSGGLLWDGGLAVCTAIGDQRLPQIAASGRGTAIATWLDYRLGNSNSDIYAQRIPFNHPPDCSAATGSVTSIWPPDHRYEPVSIEGVTDPDGDSLTITVTGITQDELPNARGGGNTCPDAQIVGGRASVRAERSGAAGGTGNGRVYGIQFTANDGH